MADYDQNAYASSLAGFYVTILIRNNESNAAFDVLRLFGEGGPFRPTEYVYARLFQAICNRKQLGPGDEERVEYRNASDVRLVWKDLLKRAVETPGLVSTYGLFYSLHVLAKGRPGDRWYAFDLIRNHLGLAEPGERTLPRQANLNPVTLNAVLLLCLITRKYHLCIHYVLQLTDEAVAENNKSIIDTGHMEKVLQSYASLVAAQSVGESDRAVKTLEWMHEYSALGWNVEPSATAYGWGLMACWKGGHWANAVRIVELMTGCHAEDFIDSPQCSPPRLDERSKGRMIVPNARDMSCLLRAALASGEVANMRQCLRMGAFFGDLRSRGMASMEIYLTGGDHSDSAAAKKENQYYVTQVAWELVKVLRCVLKEGDSGANASEMGKWRKLRGVARKGTTVHFVGDHDPTHMQVVDRRMSYHRRGPTDELH